jgi:RNA polymerase sigma-70 factor (ECF subfamily)
MPPPSDEREVIRRARKGDKAAVSALYEAYAQTVFQYISYRVDSDATAEDLTADVFLRMVRGLPQYEFTGAPFGAWLFRIAANRITDYYREGRREMVEISEDYKSDAPDLFDQLTKEEERSRLHQALQALSEDFQNIITLRFMKEMSHAEVAVVIGKSEAAVRVMQHRALKALAVELDRLQGNETGRGDDE